jgi:vacuolar-type H+-ATPase subunit E/Vma4
MAKKDAMIASPELDLVQQALAEAQDSVHNAMAKLRASASGSYQAARSLRLEARRERMSSSGSRPRSAIKL